MFGIIYLNHSHNILAIYKQAVWLFLLIIEVLRYTFPRSPQLTIHSLASYESSLLSIIYM